MDYREGVHGSLQAQARIWNHVLAFINGMSLKCAVELRIPEAIHERGGQPVTLSQLVSDLGIPPGKAASVRRLMRLLTHSGFFAMQSTCDGEEAYLLTNLSKHLLRDNRHSTNPLILLQLDPWLVTPWQSLSAWFHGDSPTPFQQLHGASFWELASQKPELNDMFNKAMASDSYLTMDFAIREHGEVFHGLKSLVDVGGGNGAAAMSLAEAFPNLKCTVLELPHVVACAPKSTTVEFIAGDMFEYVPPADAALLKVSYGQDGTQIFIILTYIYMFFVFLNFYCCNHAFDCERWQWILHDWDDEHCVNLLKLCKEAIPPKEEGGKVIIVDMVLSEDHRRSELQETQYFYDLMMMVNYGGKERSEQEWWRLFTDAGFSGYKITPGLGLRAIIELYP